MQYVDTTLVDLGAVTESTLGVPIGKDEDFVSETQMDD